MAIVLLVFDKVSDIDSEQIKELCDESEETELYIFVALGLTMEQQ